MKRLSFLLSVLLSLFLSTSFLKAQQPPVLGGAAAATVRIPSHGCSCTIIYTEPGRSLMLGCGHGYEGYEQKKDKNGRIYNTGRLMKDVPMSFDVPTNVSGVRGPAHSKLLAVDYDKDLSLVEIDKGPFPYVAYVAPLNLIPDIPKHKIIAAGYDNMTFPPHQEMAHIVDKNSKLWFTKEKPWHGRSGGGLIDVDAGCLIGVCEGFEVPPRGNRGMYVNLETIHSFLQAHWPQYSRPPPSSSQQQIIITPAPKQKRTYIEIPKEIRVHNDSGNQCWACALETAAKYEKIEQLYDLTKTYKNSSDYGPVERMLNNRHVKHKSTPPGTTDIGIFTEAIEAGYPVAWGRGGTHMMLLVGIDDKNVKILANSSDTEVHEEPLWAFKKDWDGWAIVLYPNVNSGGEDRPSQIPQNKGSDLLPHLEYKVERYYVPRQQPNCPT